MLKTWLTGGSSQSRFGKEELVASFAAAPFAAIIADAGGRYIHVNAAACVLLGRSEDELLGMNFLSITHPESLETDLSGLEQLTHGRASTFQTETRWFHNSGDVLWVKVSISAIRDEQGSPLFYIAGVEDITPRKRAEEERQRLQEIVQRNETLLAMGSLVGGVAHEVRNPLFAITATLDAMEARLGEREEHSRYIRVLRAETARMTELMERLLDYGKPAAAAHGKVEIMDILRAAERIVELHARKKQITFMMPSPATELIVLASRVRLVAAFQNIFDNAVHFSPASAVVAVELASTSNSVVVTVRDRGPGILPGEEKRIFQPFYTRRPAGTGLGLSIVQKTIHENGGQVRAFNHPEGGAVIEVTLPLTF
jgi:PAS domain S-box-containing protein